MKTNIRNPRQKSYLRAAHCVLASAMLLLAGSFTASAFTAADARTCYQAWFNTFSGQSINVDGWWTGAEKIEMVEDVGFNATDVNTMCNEFTTANGTNWSGNSFNDDVCWACIAFVRAYNITGNTTYRTLAKNNFDMMYARGWDTSAGGLWWNTSDNSKNACVNFPGSIAAHLLSVALNDSSYATKSLNIFNWGKTNFFVSSSGSVKDSLSSSANYTYNSGTFMGAAFYNGDSTDATTAGNYVMNTYGTDMQSFGSGDAAGFNGICLRWMGVVGYNMSYRQGVASHAWSLRNTNNLVNNGWGGQTGNGTQDGWSCTDIVVAMMAVQPDGANGVVNNGTYKIVNLNSGLVADCKHDESTNGTPIQQYTYSDGANQQWTLTSLVGGEYEIMGVASGRALEVVGNGTANGTFIDILDYSGGANQQWSLTATSGGYYRVTPANATDKSLDVQHSGTTNSIPLEIWTYGGGNSQQWSFQAP